MKELKLKLKDDKSGQLTLQNPNMHAGVDKNNTITYKIVKIPDNIDNAEVLRLANSTTFFCKRFTFDFAELGQGVIIKDAKKAEEENV